MSTTSIPEIKIQLFELLSQLSQEQQRQVLNFAVSLNQQNLIESGNNISDEEAAALKAEFTEEDLTFSETIITDYLSRLQHEDQL